VVSPPGAGKTSLVATYIESRKLPAIWYELDNGDADPATFFYYLELASARGAARQRKPLPLLTPEYLPDLPGFARRFFEELYARPPSPSLLVLDNYQEVPGESSFHVVIDQALARVPEAINVIVVSRTGPPAQLSRHVANGLIAQLDFHDLRLTFEETVEIANAKQKLNEEALRALHAQAEGWAAGTILMIERMKRTGALNFISHAETMDTVFNYFAGQVFNDLPAAARDVLLLTNLLPRVTVSMAAELTGSSDAGQVLDYLHRNHLFTQRRTGEEITYHYHALFRAFLLARARERYTPVGLAQVRQGAARLLEAHGEAEGAILLYQEALDWAGATSLILKEAQALFRQGRQETLRNWITAVPDDALEASPRLLLWLGCCDLAVNPPQARRTLERAFELMHDPQDALGQAIAAACIVETHHLERADFNALDRWIIELERLLSRDLTFPSKELELRTVCGMLGATMSRQSRHPMLAQCAERAMSLLTEDLEINHVVTAGTLLLHYFCNVGCDMANAARVVARVDPLLRRAELAALQRVLWLSRYGRYSSFLAHFEIASRSFSEALEIIEKEGLHFCVPVVQTHELLMSMTLADASRARALVAKLAPAINPARRIDFSILDLVRSWIALQDADTEEALRCGQSALATASEAGAVAIQALCLLALAAAWSERQDAANARCCIEQARARTTPPGARLVEHFGLMLEAGSALRDGRLDEASELLQSMLRIAKQEGYVNMSWHPRLVSCLCEFALQHGIEVEYVRSKIRKCGVSPASPSSEHWPWLVKVYTLGRFAVARDGEPVTFTGKAQKKPFDLLKALIALGGRNVDFTALMGILWPDATGDAQKSFEMTLSRLRKLLGQSDVVLVQDGKLTLNPHFVWVDAWAFERVLPRVGGDLMEDSDGAQRAFDLYKGRFLEREPKAPWMQAMADRLQAKFLRLVLAMGRSRETTSWERAAQVYERGLDLDNLAEELYRRLMICHRERGRVADAMNVYRRCRENLSIILGVAPSADTVALYNSLRHDHEIAEGS
jgi:ATP/maltotriose-dependent transcriptional regulator MalT